jgi:hypothetical protein
MKFPKSRANVFIVMRTTTYDDGISWSDPVSVGVFELYEVATDYAGECYQEWADKGANIENIKFDVQMSTFYG